VGFSCPPIISISLRRASQILTLPSAFFEVQ